MAAIYYTPRTDCCFDHKNTRHPSVPKAQRMTPTRPTVYLMFLYLLIAQGRRELQRAGLPCDGQTCADPPNVANRLLTAPVVSSTKVYINTWVRTRTRNHSTRNAPNLRRLASRLSHLCRLPSFTSSTLSCPRKRRRARRDFLD